MISTAAPVDADNARAAASGSDSPVSCSASDAFGVSTASDAAGSSRAGAGFEHDGPAGGLGAARRRRDDDALADLVAEEDDARGARRSGGCGGEPRGGGRPAAWREPRRRRVAVGRPRPRRAPSPSGGGVGVERGVRAGRDRDLVLARRVDDDQRDAGRRVDPRHAGHVDALVAQRRHRFVAHRVLADRADERHRRRRAGPPRRPGWRSCRRRRRRTCRRRRSRRPRAGARRRPRGRR